jgi:hypothetical protein
MPKKCAFVDEEGVRCGIQPAFNNTGETTGLYCGAHRVEGMVDVISAICSFENCFKTPIYNFEGKTKRLFCGEHKLPGMINIKNNRCEYPGCKTIPIYNIEGSKKAKYCASHKSDDMINVIKKRCIQTGCKNYAYFNNPFEKTPLYCNCHRTSELIDVTHKKCLYDKCNVIACFNVEGNRTGLYCSLHKQEGMIDVTAKRCVYPNCKITAHFNYENEKKPLYCLAHRFENMINVTSKICIHQGCKKKPRYNTTTELSPLYCFEHKLPNMKDIVSKTCKNEWCNTFVRNKYEGYCLNCFIHAHPDKPVSRNYKTKERCVVEYITSHFPDFSWVADKTITDGCSRRRPDMILDLGYQVVIVEVDEDCHANYDCSCENKRIMELSQDVGHKPIVFIRFNPDEYTGEDGNGVTSCWGVNGKGICVVKKSKEKEWESRLERLREQVEYWTNPDNATEKTVEIIELFYDCD